MAWWLAYSRVEPFGPVREDLRAATCAAATINGYARKPVRPWDIFDTLAKPRGMTAGEFGRLLKAKYGGKRNG